MKRTKRAKIQNNGIIYSAYNSQQVTNALDLVLETRDRLLFRTIFKGCKLGYIRGEEYKCKNASRNEGSGDTWKQAIRNKYFWLSVVLLLPILLFVLYLYMKWKDGWVYTPEVFIGLLIVLLCLYILLCYVVYQEYFQIINVPIYWGEQSNMVLWEDREKQRYHLWRRPVFLGFVKHSIKQGSLQTMQLSDTYLEAARDLSWLRCICMISEKMKMFENQYGRENIRVEISGAGEDYIFMLTGSSRGDTDSVIPVDAQTEKKVFMIPCMIGNSIVKKYNDRGILDLSIFDRRYEKIESSGIIDRCDRDKSSKSKGTLTQR